MSDLKERLLQELSNSVVDMDDVKTIEIAQNFVKNNLDAYEAIDQGLASGMERAGKLYEEEEYYIPELLMCSDAMYAGLDVLKPYLGKNEGGHKYKVVIGVVEGDTHDIGKNLVKIMLETSGFEVVDLGRDVPPMAFVEKAKEIDADIIALSTLMTTTMENMEKVVQILKDERNDKIKVMVGGGCISPKFADKIGAYYSSDASKAAKMARSLVEATMVC
ncbi:MAG: corrinoid protein [Anaerolineaceae bacterium]|nr:corrinoid protein [Anaerolineaceae bacterium]